jgi:hypothetical protein
MTAAQEIQKRNEKAQHLRVIQVDEANYFVESEEGQICYKCHLDGDGNFCTCGDFARNSKNDPNFRCKHLLSIMNCVPNEIKRAEFLEKTKPKLDERFVITIEGQDFVKYSGLLDLAHQRKLTNLEIEVLQYPTQENEKTAICRAKAQTALGDVFSDIGDANPANCNYKVGKHLLRMASTRAKARVLRDLNNIGMTCLEELGDLDEVIGNEEKGTAQKGRIKSFPKKMVKSGASVSQLGKEEGDVTGPADSARVESSASATVNKEVKQPAKEAAKDDKKATVENQPVTKGAEKSGGNGKNKTKTDIPPVMSEAQRRAVYNLSRRRGISVDELEKMAQNAYGVSLEKLTASDASSFIRQLQQSA